jgi:hypothetical protein
MKAAISPDDLLRRTHESSGICVCVCVCVCARVHAPARIVCVHIRVYEREIRGNLSLCLCVSVCVHPSPREQRHLSRCVCARVYIQVYESTSGDEEGKEGGERGRGAERGVRAGRGEERSDRASQGQRHSGSSRPISPGHAAAGVGAVRVQ